MVKKACIASILVTVIASDEQNKKKEIFMTKFVDIDLLREFLVLLYTISLSVTQ